MAPLIQPDTISLIIPAYNEEQYLAACIEHALAQGTDAFAEIIVVDNASTDGTAAVAARYADRGVRVVTETARGLTRARQRGFLEARGSILAYVDADTHMPKGWAQRVMHHMANRHVAAVSGPYRYYDLNAFLSFFVSLYWYLLGLPMYLYTGFMIVGGNFAIRKEVVSRMGGFDTSIDFYGEDTDIARRAHAHGKVRFLLTLAMPTSARRFKGQGFWHTGYVYAKNFFTTAFHGKPATTEHQDIR